MEHVLEEFLEDYNASTTTPMKLVLFQDAMDHICRINRILRQPRGNALLLGMGGSGDVEKMFRTIRCSSNFSTFLFLPFLCANQRTHIALEIVQLEIVVTTAERTVVKGVKRQLSKRKLLERSIKYRETWLARKSFLRVIQLFPRVLRLFFFFFFFDSLILVNPRSTRNASSYHRHLFEHR